MSDELQDIYLTAQSLAKQVGDVSYIIMYLTALIISHDCLMFLIN